jgi:hypothetical protein
MHLERAGFSRSVDEIEYISNNLDNVRVSPAKPRHDKVEPNKPHETPVPKAVRVNQAIKDDDILKSDEIQIDFSEEIDAPENADIEPASHQSVAHPSPIANRHLMPDQIDNDNNT